MAEKNIDPADRKEKVFNKRILVFAAYTFILMLSSLFFFFIEETGLGVFGAVFSLTVGLALVLTTPVSYVFSEEKLVINYFFGLKENIPWQNVRYVLKNHEKVTRYRYLGIFEVGYYFKEKRPFYMRGRVSKNKKTKALLEKYCPTGVR